MLEIVPASIVVEPTVAGGPNEHVDLRRYTAHCRGTTCCRTSGTPIDRELVAAVARLAGVAAHTVAGADLEGS